MPDNRSICAKCGQIYGEPYATQCDCYYEAQKLREENPNLGYQEPEDKKAWCQLCGKPVVETIDGSFYPTCDCSTKPLNSKDTNPKDAVGTKKVPFSTLPAKVLAEVGLALLEGARKYGRHNYRAVGVRGSVYYDACLRHLTQWWEGEDVDPDSGLSHVTKAIAGLVVLRDSMMMQNWKDDRPPKIKDGWVQELNQKAAEIIEKYPNALEPYTELNKERKPQC